MFFEAFMVAHTFQPAFTVSRRTKKGDEGEEEEEEDGMQLYSARDTHAPVTSVSAKERCRITPESKRSP